MYFQIISHIGDSPPPLPFWSMAPSSLTWILVLVFVGLIASTFALLQTSQYNRQIILLKWRIVLPLCSESPVAPPLRTFSTWLRRLVWCGSLLPCWLHLLLFSSWLYHTGPLADLICAMHTSLLGLLSSFFLLWCSSQHGQVPQFFAQMLPSQKTLNTSYLIKIVHCLLHTSSPSMYPVPIHFPPPVIF